MQRLYGLIKSNDEAICKSKNPDVNHNILIIFWYPHLMNMYCMHSFHRSDAYHGHENPGGIYMTSHDGIERFWRDLFLYSIFSASINLMASVYALFPEYLISSWMSSETTIQGRLFLT